MRIRAKHDCCFINHSAASNSAGARAAHAGAGSAIFPSEAAPTMRLSSSPPLVQPAEKFPQPGAFETFRDNRKSAPRARSIADGNPGGWENALINIPFARDCKVLSWAFWVL